MPIWEPHSTDTPPRSRDYVWRLISHDLMPLRGRCLTFCSTYAGSWTAWKSCWVMLCKSEPWLGDEQWRSHTRLTTLGMPPQSGREMLLFAMNTPALESVQRLRTSKYLTCVGLRELLTASPVAAMRRWSSFGYAIEASRGSGKTSCRSFEHGNGNQLWSADHAPEPIQDIREWQRRMREREGW